MGPLIATQSPVLFIAAAIAAMLAPLSGTGSQNQSSLAGFPGWPTHYEGRPLAPLPLSAREQKFLQDFPGHLGRFSDGEREVIIRWVAKPTRLLHPAADCFRGIGYAITPLPLKSNSSGTLMGCFRADRDGQSVNVCESLNNDRGETWSDASSWYWSALFGSSTGPWWSFVSAETIADAERG